MVIGEKFGFEGYRSLSRLMLVIMIPALLVSNVSASPAETDTLAFFQEEAKVVTASRFEQPLSEAPMAVEIITSEEIEASGAVNFWDLMRFVPGMDVSDSRSSDGNRAIVAVRGLPSANAANLQVLVDGRSIYSPLTGGVSWQAIPVPIQDVERIEIVRGPNAALYGSNAAQGTINIITRKPSTRGLLTAQGRLGNLGDKTTYASYETLAGDFGFRASHAYAEQEGFRRPGGANGDDELASNWGNFRSFWTPNAGTHAEMMGGVNREVYDLHGLLDGSRTVLNKSFEMLKLSQALGASTIDLLVSNQRTTTEATPSPNVLESQQDVEIQQRFSWLNDRVNTTWGGSRREALAESTDLFRSHPEQSNDIQRVFTEQRVKVTSRLTLTGAISLERSDTGGKLIAYQAASLYRLTPMQMLRFTYALAPTLPTLFAERADYQPSPNVRLVGNEALDASRVKSAEIGYQGYFQQRRLEADLNVHSATLSNLTVSQTQVTFVPAFLATSLTSNGNHAVERGAEAEFKYHFDQGHSAYVNYTFEKLSDDRGNLSIKDGTPKHKLNLGGIARLGGGFTASTNVGYKDAYLATSDSGTAWVSAYWRLDARLAYKIREAEIFIAGQNLTRPEKVEAADGLAVARTYQTGLTLAFGGVK